MGGLCDIRYTVYRLSSGGYYKYSSGGTPVFLFSQGYGQQGQDDLGDVYRFRWVSMHGTQHACAACCLLHGSGSGCSWLRLPFCQGCACMLFAAAARHLLQRPADEADVRVCCCPNWSWCWEGCD